jgi:hypothetical protein
LSCCSYQDGKTHIKLVGGIGVVRASVSAAVLGIFKIVRNLYQPRRMKVSSSELDAVFWGLTMLRLVMAEGVFGFFDDA